MKCRLPSVCLFLLMWSAGCATFDGEGQGERSAVEIGENSGGDIDKSVFNNLGQDRGLNDFHERAFEAKQFYEIQINYKTRAEYEYWVREKVKPLVEELEAHGLIQGFHFIMHETLDLRLEIEDEKTISVVANKVIESGIPFSEIKLWNGFTENSREYKWYGPEGIAILLQSLESNSRLLMDLLQFKENARNLPLGKDKTVDYLNHQMVHYFLIQQGIGNLEQVKFSLQDAQFWLDTISNNGSEVDAPQTPPQ